MTVLANLDPTKYFEINEPISRSPTRFIVFIAFLCISTIALLGTLKLTIQGNATDWLSYWASAHQLVRHENPYDKAAILKLEGENGFTSPARALMMRNAPNALFLMIPMGYLTPYACGVAWRLLMIACLALSVRLLWLMLNRPLNRWYLLAFCFTPVFGSIVMGQSSIFALLGLTLFFRFYEEKPVIAGFGLSLCLIKPHLFLVFGTAVILWAILHRAYALLAATTICLIGESLLPLYFDRAVWGHYRAMVAADGIQSQFLPTIGCAVRNWLDSQAFWIAFIPVVCGCAWVACYFYSNRRSWTWLDNGSLVILVSIAATPYIWPSDYVILVPAIILALYRRPGVSLTLLLLSICTASIQLLAGTTTNSPLYLWQSVFWLAWYLLPQIRVAVRSNSVVIEPT